MKEAIKQYHCANAPEANRAYIDATSKFIEDARLPQSLLKFISESLCWIEVFKDKHGEALDMNRVSSLWISDEENAIEMWLAGYLTYRMR